MRDHRDALIEEGGAEVVSQLRSEPTGERPVMLDQSLPIRRRSAPRAVGVEPSIVGVPVEQLIRTLSAQDASIAAGLDREQLGHEDAERGFRDASQFRAPVGENLAHIRSLESPDRDGSAEEVGPLSGGADVRAVDDSHHDKMHLGRSRGQPRHEGGVDTPREENRKASDAPCTALDGRRKLPRQRRDRIVLQRRWFHGVRSPAHLLSAPVVASGMAEVGRSPAPAVGGTDRLRRAVYIDRDGTINPDLRYLKESDRLEVFRGVGEALRLLRAHGFVVVCVTNQSGIERGFYTVADVEAIHRRVNEILAREGAAIDAFYYCPHAPEAGCRCRKPGTELFERAERELGLARAGSAVIGDRVLDVQAGDRLGLLTVLVVPPGHEESVAHEMAAAHVHADLSALSMRAAAARLMAIG
jgi:D-glycero-D-manno-heptose 1,7-bisphosphate phosphatase